MPTSLPFFARKALQELHLSVTTFEAWALVKASGDWRWIVFTRDETGTIRTCSSDAPRAAGAALRWDICNLTTARRLWERAVASGWEPVEAHL